MLKVGNKRRRTTTEIQQEKEEELLRAQDVAEKMAKLNKLEKKSKELEAKAGNNETASVILTNLIA